MNPRKLEHRSRTIHAGIPYTLFQGHEATSGLGFKNNPGSGGLGVGV